MAKRTFSPRACTKCGVVKDAAGFYASPRYADGFTRQCRLCIYQRTAARHRRVREETGKWPSQATARTPQRRAYEAEYRSRPETKAKSVAKQRRYRYGITDDEYAAMVLASGGLCAICNEAMGDDICVDHCHDSGAVRGLLCRNCNFGLGHFRDDPARLTAALAYLTA
jgi:Recombination endonuclease VII.